MAKPGWAMTGLASTLVSAAFLPGWLASVLVTLVVLTCLGLAVICLAGPELRRWVEMWWAHQRDSTSHLNSANDAAQSLPVGDRAA